ncbi:MAG: ECF transporter S component [Oscillospiraceae bacterium]|nr:ECF transporter S component [Oscillospiraceae bacterium]
MAEIVISVLLIIITVLVSKQFLSLGVRGICVVAILVALASAGRTLFLSIPSVQPASFIIMLCGATFGGPAGFFCGMLTAVVSNLFAGLGPWTFYQMFFWGLMGLFARKPLRSKLWVRVVYGFAWGFIFGWGMNLWGLFYGIIPMKPGAFITSCVLSFNFDLAHAVTNAALIAAFSGWTTKLLDKLSPPNSGSERR